MTLLTTMMERPLDPAYEDAADRRERAGLPRATSTRSLLVAVVALLTGFMFAVSAGALRPKPTAAADLRGGLIEQIEAVQTAGEAKEQTIADLTRQVQEQEALALARSGENSVAQQVQRLQVASHTVALRGPGVTITLDDAPRLDDPGDGGIRPDSAFEAGRVTAQDLQIVVNYLWGAGAEAISINGHRLTSTAAIRFAGQALIVDFRPLSRPYVVTALGDPDTTLRMFEPSFGGAYLEELRREFGIVATTQQHDELEVPGATARVLVAEPLRPVISAPPTSSSETLETAEAQTDAALEPESVGTGTP